MMKGIITDGDLRRQLENGADIYSLKVSDIMNFSPKTISSEKLAVDALNMMKNYNISCLVVENNKAVVGIIRTQDILKAGIVL